jgi:branched-chain amino acid transport system ATP-binding protein
MAGAGDAAVAEMATVLPGHVRDSTQAVYDARCRMLKVNGLWVSIKGFVILRGINLDIPPGGLIGLVGRNGAGKTTTLKSIMGILPASAGSLRFDGDDLMRVPAYRRPHMGIGYMPEDRRLIGALSVEDNILLPAWATGVDDGHGRLSSIYQRLPGVRALAGRRASQLSGGQQKLVALARALMNGTKLLLLDEPFEGLSPAFGETLADTIRELRRASLSVLIAESDLKRISFCDTIYTIERGEMIERVDA